MSYRMLPPPRPRRSPLLLMIVLAMIPAAAFAYTWRWAEAKIPPDALGTAASTTTSTTVLGAVPSEDIPVTTPGTGTASGSSGVTTSSVVPTPVVALATPVLSVRRVPQTIVQLTSESSLVNSLALLSGFVGDTSCLVVSLDGRIIYDHNGDVAVTPASNQKLLVAAVALELLTPEYTFTTRLLGDLSDGTVSDDLYFVGGGDPLLSTANYPETQQYPPTSVTALETLVSNLVAAGVTRIQGNVIADESRYDDERYVPTWSDDISGIEAGPLSALMVNDALRRVEVGSTQRQQDPAVGAATELITLLEAAGISVSGSARAGVAPAETPEITNVQSAPLSAIVAEMLTTSDDNTAELLVKEIAVAKQLGNSRAAGLEIISATLSSWGVDVTKLTLVDGSGLDSGNIATCNILRQVLTRQPLSGPLGAGLAVAGETGTLADDTTLGSAMTGRLHAKTGTLTDAKSLSGYVTTDAGQIEFSLVLDIPDAASSYEGIWGALGDAFSKYPSGPTVADIQPR